MCELDSSTELSHNEVQKVMSTVDIPACPATVTLAMQEAQKDEPDIRRLAEIITNDPGMSAAALKLANSPIYGSGQRISSVPRAVERLGTKNIVCVVVASALRGCITGLSAVWLESFWKKTSQLAVVASLIARRQYGMSPDAAYTYALFHDAAIPLMMKRFPTYTEVLDKCLAEGRMLVVAEGASFPCTHPIVGALLVRNWGLPSTLGLAIRFHHDEDVYDVSDRTLPGDALSLIAVTHVAERLIHEVLESDDLEVGAHLYGRALSYLGISEDDLDGLRRTVEEYLGGGG